MLGWLYLTFLRGGFWTVRDKRLPVLGTRNAPPVAVIIPARDEADVIGTALASVVAQQYSGEMRVFVVDDNSSDGTSDIVRSVTAGQERSASVIAGRPLPHGWAGKVWAMQQGWDAARAFAPAFVLLTDADVVHSPGNLRALVAKAEEDHSDLVSLMVRLHCHTFAEKLLIPAFVYFFFMLYPPQWIAEPRKKTAGAAGGCVLIRATMLEKLGGFDCIRGEIIDDCSLAREVKHAGGRLWLGLAEETRSVRPYDGFGGILKMISRTAFNQLQHSWLLLAGCIAGMTVLFLAPAVLSFGSNVVVRAVSAVALLLMGMTYLPLVRWYHVTPFAALSLPIAAVFYLAATLHSAFKFATNEGGVWKGRAQDA